MAAHILQVSSLTAGYKQKAVIHDISFSVDAGDFLCVVAPNGTGKTTLLRCLAGVLAVFEGAVRLKDKDINSYSRRDLARTIAVVAEEADTFDYTVGQMVTMGRYPHIGRFGAVTVRDRAIVQAAMDSVKIGHKRNSVMGELSQGEKQKVIIARALAQCPDLLLLDEPTSHLDVCNQYSILCLIRQLAEKRGIGVVAVIHDINLALQYGTHLLLLKEGRTAAYGAPASILSAKLLQSVYGIEFGIHQHMDLTFVYPFPAH